MTVTCFPVRCVNPICHFQKIFKSKCVGGGLNSAPLHLCTRGEEYSSRVRPKGKKKRKHSATSANLKTVQTACFFSPPPPPPLLSLAARRDSLLPACVQPLDSPLSQQHPRNQCTSSRSQGLPKADPRAFTERDKKGNF